MFILEDDVSDKLNAQKGLGTAQICAMTADYEQGFSEVREPSPETLISFRPLISQDDSSVQIADNFQVYGEGETAQEAVEKWRLDLSTKLQNGKMLLWRVRPEIDWSYDFRAKLPRWRVYARAAVLS